jgi:hypothetical protein
VAHSAIGVAPPCVRIDIRQAKYALGTQAFKTGTSGSNVLTRISEVGVNRDVALRIDGMLTGIRGNLDGLAFYMKSNLSDEEYFQAIKQVGRAMGELVELSGSLHFEFPDIIPKELIPPENGGTPT